MNRSPFLILHKTEWDRLQRQGGTYENPVNVQREYLKTLTDQSQEWMKTWPDSVAVSFTPIATNLLLVPRYGELDL